MCYTTVTAVTDNIYDKKSNKKHLILVEALVEIVFVLDSILYRKVG